MEELQNEKSQSPVFNAKEELLAYSLEELKYQAAKNHLVGNFDKERNYQILEIIYPELFHLKKTISSRTPKKIWAYATVLKQKIWFSVSLEKQDNGMLRACLVLEEKIVLAQTVEIPLSSPIKTFFGPDTPEFESKMREFFHLVFQDEPDEKNLLEHYISPPIELVSELVKKNNILQARQNKREEAVKDYFADILKVLKSTPEGSNFARNFFMQIRNEPLKNIQENRLESFKEFLDYLLDQEIANSVFSEKQIEEIAKVRKNFIEQTQKNMVEFLEDKSKALAPVVKEKPAPKPQEKAKGGAGGSGSKSASSASLPPSTAGKFFDKETPSSSSVIMPTYQVKEKKKLQAKAPKTPEIFASEKPEFVDLNDSILNRAVSVAKEQEPTLMTPETLQTVYQEAIMIGVSQNFGVKITYSQTVSVTKEYSLGLEL